MPRLATLIGVLPIFAIACAAHAEPIISEFMASNTNVLADGDGNFSDWIEVHNPDPLEADLSAWGLRDGVEIWSFPEGAVVDPGGYLVVFASGQSTANYTDAGGNFHTTFKLAASGEALSLLRPDGSVAFQYAAVPEQHEDISYGLITETESFLTPSSSARYLVPGVAFGDAWRGLGFDDSGWAVGKAAVGFNLGQGAVLEAGGGGEFTAFGVQSGTVGNQAYSGALGMDFTVTEEVRVTDLGVFDDGSDGLALTINAQLWSRSGNTGVAILASETFTPGDPGTLDGGSRFKPLSEVVVLVPGDYTMVAYGYGAAERNGNQGSNDDWNIDGAGGILQFVGGSRYGAAGGFPGTVDGGSANRYAAGTFKFSPDGSKDFETDIELPMSGTSASVFVRIPFDVPDAASFDALQLHIGYDDGLVAWVNGIEIARRNAPATLASDSTASAEGNATISLPAALPEGSLLTSGNVLAIHGLNVAASDSDFIVSPSLLGVKTDTLATRYFSSPTPGEPNDPAGVIGFVEDTAFSVDRGFFEAPFDVAITTPTQDATIRYTTDGSVPTEVNGTDYTAPLRVSSTTVLRAAAFKPDYEPTRVDTQSYLFLDDVATRDNSPPGYPANWGGITADYSMDRDVADYVRAAGDAGFSPSEAKAAIAASLSAIPTLSVVTDMDHLFDPGTGIYVNPSGRGVNWERPVSVELIDSTGAGRFQVDAGLRIMGFTSRNLNATPKLNMRLLFKKEYGAGQLDYPLLGADGPARFNTIALRGNLRDSWISGSGIYIGDEWTSRSQFAMGQPAVRGIFVHLYLNGIYWGLYNPTERPDDAFAETYFGGDRTDYDVVKFCCPDRAIAGTTAVWDTLIAESRSGLADGASYQRIQGKNPDGTPNPAFPVLIDIDNFIDYVINGQYLASGDWPGNYYVSRDRVEGRSEGFKYFTWDNDLTFSSSNPNSGNKVQTSPGHNWWTESPGEMDIALRANAEYRMRFADRVYKHYHHGGAMTVENNISRWNSLASIVRPALFAESARWGDARSSLRTVQGDWDGRIAGIVNTYFPGRQSVVFGQMRAHGLYPELDAPEFNQHGGAVPMGFGVNFDADATVYYTTDGSDPRLTGGAISPNAAAASAGSMTTKLIDTGDTLRAWVPVDDRHDNEWRNPAFDDASWATGTSGVGYESGSGYAAEISLNLLNTMRLVRSSAYIRIPFAGAEPADFQSLTLKMKYDDGFIAYLNGVEIASRNPR